jgi:hypothetical protein
VVRGEHDAEDGEHAVETGVGEAERLGVALDPLDVVAAMVPLQRPPEVCYLPPGYEEDLVLVTTAEWLTEWHAGQLSLGDALHAGLMELRAPLHLERMLARMGGRGRLNPPAVPA